MAEQQESIFRKQSIDSVSSPEQLNDYIKSATPSVWFILGAVIVFLIGVCVWGVFGHFDTKITSGGMCEGGTLTLYIPEKYEKTLKAGMTVVVNGERYPIQSVSDVPVHIHDKTDPYLMHISGIREGDFAITATAETALPDGVYTTVVTVESISPISFIIN